jgi:YVTN family beta-propeller protein
MLVAVLALASCSDDSDPNVLTVTPGEVNLDAFQAQQLTAELRTSDGAAVPGATYTWVSAETDIATVNATGLVTAVAGGSTTITVTSAGVTRGVSVAVASVATSIQVAPSTVRLTQGSVENLAVAIYNERGVLMPNAVAGFTTSSGIATVTGLGVVTAIGAGQGTITVTSGAASTNVPLVFTGHPAGVPGPRLTLGFRPFGVAVGSDSVLLATQLDAATMGKSRTDLATFPASISVGGTPTSVVIGPGPEAAYVANQGGDISFVNVPTATTFSSVAVPGSVFRVIIGYGDPPVIYVAGNSDSVFAINTLTQAIIRRVEVGLDPNGLALAPSGGALYVTNMSGGTLSEVELGGFTVTRTIVLGGTPQDVVVSPDGTELYVANESGLLQVVNLGTGNVTDGGTGTDHLFGLALSPDNKVLVGTRQGPGQVVLIDRATRQVITTLNTGGVPRRVAFDLLGSIAAVANEAGWVDLIR